MMKVFYRAIRWRLSQNDCKNRGFILQNFPRFTPEEYFDWEEQQQLRHEYLDGEVYAMTGGTLNHSEIAINFGGYVTRNLHLAIISWKGKGVGEQD